MSLLNNVVEFPSDAFKIVTHFRHPLPQRTDTIGPWLDCLSFIAWLSALTNSALVYLFRPQAKAVNNGASVPAGMGRVEIERGRQGMHEVLGRALFIALAASHGYILLQVGVRHVLERALWYGSPEKARRDASARQVKERYLQSVEGGGGAQGLGIMTGVSRSSSLSAGLGVGMSPEVAPLPPPLPPATGKGPTPPPLVPPPGEFWQFDEGLDEIRKGIKEA